MSDLSPTMTEAEYVAKLEEVGRVGRHLMFHLGDLILYGEARWGERAYQYADKAGYSPKTLQNAAYVAQAIPPARRREILSFGHHAAVAGLPESQQERLLTDAATALEAHQPITVNDLRELAHAETHTEATPIRSMWAVADALAQASLDYVRACQFHERTPGADPPDCRELLALVSEWRTRRGR